MPLAEASRMRGLFVHRFFFRLALALGNIFAWIIVFRLFYIVGSLEYALAGTAALYTLSHAITFILTPLSGMMLRHGVRRALILGTFTGAASFALLSFVFFEIPFSRENSFWLISGFVVIHGMYRALYWIPYKTAEAAGIARSPSVLAREAVAALMPALGGLILMMHNGPFFLLCFTALGMLGSACLLFSTEETYEGYDWTYGETLREVCARKNSRVVGLFILDGIQGAALLLIWPLAAYLILGQSFQALGAVLTGTLCVAFLGRYLVRRLLRAFKISHSPTVLAAIVFSSWMLRLTAASPVQILVVDTYYNSGTSPRRFSIDSYAFEQTADGGHFVDEYTAVKEMGLSIGRIAITLLFIVVALTTAESVAFAATIFTAGIAAAWSVVIAHRLEKLL